MIHSFDKAIAKEYGIHAAILFRNIAYWCEHNATNNKNFHDGLYWTYNSCEAFEKQFDYLSAKQIRTALQKLIDSGLIVKGNFNANPYDRTLWYAITKKGISILPEGQMDFPNRENGLSPEGKPIPDIIPDINTDGGISRAREERANETTTTENPFGDDCPDHPDLDTLAVYATNNIVNMNGRNMEMLLDYRDRLSDELIRYAIDEANKRCPSGLPTFAYVDAILKGYVQRRFTNVAQVETAEASRTRQRQPKPAHDDNPLLRAKFY